jgi:zinc and cadmium transporter
MLQVVVIGIVFFFVMEKFLHWRHCHDEECAVHSFAYLNLIGDGVHNFVDGMAIAASFFVSYAIGFATTLAVVFHEIPQELGDFGVLIYGGFGRRKALTYFMSALSAVAGALAIYWLDIYVHGFERFLIPFAAGGFMYVAATDLMPQLHKETHAKESMVQLFSLLAGIGLMLVLAVLVPRA